ncbi:alanine:cation symporter family protein [Streptomyces sp. XM4193]|uniref:alanine/glycine:cation symporter family protein n=1 Tax=Streptomyces sp. XM4193 TaxID=2929782 RepID=UPI001FFA01D8|nr:alanine/glycine:cation symporter family protein [Streptomyces sp. XM4193]MCK1798499.1 alanine:cation symporter family protein [Streptomyces sp. XM4193]
MANETWTDSVDEAVNSVFEPVSTFLGDIVFVTVPFFGTDFPVIVAWLAIAGLVFTIYFGCAQARHIKAAIRITRGKYEQKDAPGEVTHFQALTSAMSGTVGLGNIAGVAIAVGLGGPGATFWMILCGLLGMASKFVECTLGVRYREFNADGTVNGGPMLYLKKGLAELGWATLGKVLAGVSAFMILFFALFGGNLFQVNQSLEQFVAVTGGEDNSWLATSAGGIVFGVVVAVIVGLVLLGGMKSVGAVTSKLVPAMGIMYVAACLLVISFNFSEVPNAIQSIFEGAFNPEGVAGGLLGALIIGFQRAAFSNEAGVGSAPIAHSAVKTKRPATEGLVAMIEPFVDTVIICTMTALTIIIASGPAYEAARESAADGEGVQGTAAGISITHDAFETALPWFPWLLTIAVFLFAVSTVITWGYYGLKSWGHIFGHSKISETIYKLLFCFMIVVGALLSLGVLVDLADATLFLAAFFNILGLYLLAPIVKKELKKVLEYVRRRDAGDTEEEIEADERAAEAAEAAAKQ